MCCCLPVLLSVIALPKMPGLGRAFDRWKEVEDSLSDGCAKQGQ